MELGNSGHGFGFILLRLPHYSGVCGLPGGEIRATLGGGRCHGGCLCPSSSDTRGRSTQSICPHRHKDLPGSGEGDSHIAHKNFYGLKICMNS